MSENIKLWHVIYDGQKYSTIPNHCDTDHQVVSTGLREWEAAQLCSKMNNAQVRTNVGNFFTGVMHMSAEAVGHCVKTIKDGYNKGRN
jgi:hypothetical protein